MSKIDQAKMLLKMRKLQKEMQNEQIVGSAGDGAVTISMTGEMKVKKVKINPEDIDLDDIGLLERWVEEAVRDAIAQSQAYAQNKMQPMLGQLGSLGF
jgi:nucleoid-associated protein EbfC